MVEMIYPNIYRIEIPLPGNPLKAINVYLVRGEMRNLIVDTGFNIPEGRALLLEALKELQMDIQHTDLLITHLHSDHCGLAAALAAEGMRVYAGVVDGALINEMTTEEYWTRFIELNTLMGMDADNISFSDHPGYKYCPKVPVAFIPLKDGDTVDLGGFRFTVLDIPGHTPGHIGLYEPDKHLLFCGDHVLDKISPNIAFWGFERDILAVYLESLDRVRALPVTLCFPAHRNLLTDPQRRIDELKQHHAHRLAEVLAIIAESPRTVRETASRMHWDLRAAGWEQFPANQKWFAAGEALSHLEHLFATGRAERVTREGVLYYTAK